MALPEIVSEEEWREARRDLLQKEKAATRARDALNTERRNLPMVEVTKDYRFSGPEGDNLSLGDLFDGRHQLIVVHFMFGPDWDAGCPSCTAAADERSPMLHEHLANRDTTLVTVARAPLSKIDAYKAQHGWTFPFYSSHGSGFNYDYGVTFAADKPVVEYNYREIGGAPTGTQTEAPGVSCFLRDGDRVFHTYSTYARGTESMGGSYYFLDLTALGRQEEWEEPKDRGAGLAPDPSGLARPMPVGTQ